MSFSSEEDFLEYYRAVNKFETTLASDINASVTSIPLSDIGALTASSKGVVSIGNEHIFYNGYSGNTLTGCSRGFEATSATSHSSGDIVQQRVDAYIFNQIIQSIFDIPKIDFSNSISATLTGDSFIPERGNVAIQLYGQGLTADDVINISSVNVNNGEIIVIECMHNLTFRNAGNLVVDPIGLSSDVLVPQYGVLGLYWHASTNRWRPIFSSLGLVNYSVTASNLLEVPTDGDFSDGHITSWSAGVTTYSDALDDINESLALLIPASPSSLSAFTLSTTGLVNSRSGINILLASSVTDNTTGGAPSAGTQVYRGTSASISSADVSGFGSGNSGTLSAMKNGVVSGSTSLTTGSQTGTYTSLIITGDSPYPISQPGFWESLTARIVSTNSGGINKYQLRHSEDGNTNEVFFVYDTSNPTPGFSAISISENTPGTLKYSSGIPHYDTNAILNFSGTVTSLASMCYLASNNVEITSTSGFGSQVNLAPGQGNLPATFSSGMGSQSITSVFTIGGTVHTVGQVQARGRNAGVDGSNTAAASIVHVMSGTPPPGLTLPVQETNLFVSTSLGSTPSGADTVAKRVAMENALYASDDLSSLTSSDWASSASVAAYEAKVVGGVLRRSVVDYTTGYLPAGPDYSSHSATQYATFYFRKSAVSQFRISVSGTYTTCMVKMFGIAGTETSTGYQDWWDMSKIYAGAGVPNRSGYDNGCAVGTVMSGSSGLFTCTFGTASSTDSTNNIILVRFSLTGSQAVTALAFRET